MQSLQAASKASTEGNAEETACARQILDTVPLVMRIIRKHMRRHRSGLTVPQFRTLCFTSTAEGSSLSAVADFIGLSLPAMSRLVDGLVEQSLIVRRTSETDRRHIRLSVTPAGEAAIREARELAQNRLASALAGLTAAQRRECARTMEALRDVFAPEAAADDEAK